MSIAQRIKDGKVVARTISELWNGLPPAVDGRKLVHAILSVPAGLLATKKRGKAIIEMLMAHPHMAPYINHIGVEPFRALFDEAKGDAALLSRWLESLGDAKRYLHGSDISHKEFLEALTAGDAGAWHILRDLEHRRFTQAAVTVEAWLEKNISGAASSRERTLRAFQRLKETQNPDERGLLVELQHMLDEGGDEAKKVTTVLWTLGHAEPHRLSGAALLLSAQRRGLMPEGWDWQDFLSPSWEFLLEPIGRVGAHTVEGFDLMLERGLRAAKSLTKRDASIAAIINMQGFWGHLLAASDAIKRFEGKYHVRLRVELSTEGAFGERIVDSVINLFDKQKGPAPVYRRGRAPTPDRIIYQEVKTNLGEEPSKEFAQMRKDLERHIRQGGDFENMFYCYHPAQADNLKEVRGALLDALEDRSLWHALKGETTLTLDEAREKLKAVLNDIVMVYEVPKKGGGKP